jgi:hypothetical protein
MQTKLNNLSRTTLVLLIATLTSGVMVSTAVSAKPQALLAVGTLVA